MPLRPQFSHKFPRGHGGPLSSAMQCRENSVDAGHQKMRDVLARIAASSKDQSPFVGDRKMREMRSMMTVPGYVERPGIDSQWRFHLDRGIAELRLGHETEAIEQFDAALSLVPKTSDKDLTAKRKATASLSMSLSRLALPTNDFRWELSGATTTRTAIRICFCHCEATTSCIATIGTARSPTSLWSLQLRNHPAVLRRGSGILTTMTSIM